MKKNPLNPHSEDEGETKQNSPMPITKGRVVEVQPKENGGRHHVHVREYGSNTPKMATVLSPSYGDVSIPEEGSDVAILYANKDKPWVIGHWYAIDRIENGNIDVPNYNAGDRIVSNGTESQLRIHDNGEIHVGTAKNEDGTNRPPYVNIDANDNISIDTDETVSIRGGSGLEITTDGSPVNTTTHSASMHIDGGTSFTVPANDELTVPWNDTEYDEGGITNENNNSIDLTANGVYRTIVRLAVDTTTDSEIDVGLYRNGNLWRKSHLGVPASSLNTVEMVTTNQFSAGDTLTVQLQNTGSSEITIADGNIHSEFTVTYVTGSET